MPYLPPGGLSPASAFDIQGQHEPAAPPAILAPLIDPNTGEIKSLFRSANLADAFAIEALRVRRGSGAAVADLGHRLAELRYVDDDVSGLAESRMRESFEDAETAGVARLETVAATVDDADGAQVGLTITYVDLNAPGSPLRRESIAL